jgi:hypothetical protein
LDTRTLSKISIAAAYILPTSKAIGNLMDLGVKRYTILNSILKNRDQNFKKLKPKARNGLTLAYPMEPLSGRSNLAGVSDSQDGQFLFMYK